MTESLIKLSNGDIDSLIDALKSARLPAPYSPIILAKYVSNSVVDDVVQDLKGLTETGFSGVQIATLLSAVKQQRASRKELDEVIELVTTGPEAPGAANRDTSVVVRELFRRAKQSVLVVGYTIYQVNRFSKPLRTGWTKVPL